MTEVEDILINTELYGIYDPTNYHSFYNSWKILLLQTCQGCEKSIFPFTAACSCLRCGAIAHRGCIKKFKEQCPYFTFEKHPNTEVVESKPQLIMKGNSIHLGNSNEEMFDSVFSLKLEQLIEKACMIPAVLGYIPKTKSQYCIWRSILRAIVIRQTTPLNRIAPMFNNDDSTSLIESTVRTCLSDLEGFAGQVSLVCFYVFLSLNGLTTADMTIQHARECLDTVTDGILCICSEEISVDTRITRAIATAVDKILLNQQDGALYDKIYQPLLIQSSMCTFRSSLAFHEPDDWDERCWLVFDRFASTLTRKRCAKDKLAVLIVLMQLLTNRNMLDGITLGPVDEEHVQEPLSSKALAIINGGTDEASIEDSSPQPDTSPSIVEANDPDIMLTAPKEKEEASSIVDEITEDIIQAVTTLTLENSKEDHSNTSATDTIKSDNERSRTSTTTIDPDMNADRLLELLGCVILRQQQSGVCNWIAEYLFLSSQIVSAEVVDTLAAEGYALATLQQAMAVLLER